MDEHIYPNEAKYHEQCAGPTWEPVPVIEELKPKARAAGLWNLFLPESERGAGLTNLEYAPLCEIMGRSPHGAGSVQLLRARYRQHGGAGALRHAGAEGAMAEAAARRRNPLVLRDDGAATSPPPTPPTSNPASCATAMITSSTGASGGVPARAIRAAKSSIFMGKTDPAAPKHKQQSMILVPMDAPGVTMKRMLTVFGYDHAPHGHGEVLLRQRARARRQSSAGRRPRIRDRAGTPGTGPHSSLHALDRPGGARARIHVPARQVPRRVRQNHRREGHDSRRYRASRAWKSNRPGC